LDLASIPSYLPDYTNLVDDPNEFNVLLMGKNGANVDTIIFANVNSVKSRVTMVSIPRDLYVNERKINSVYADYGILEQVKWIENVLGRRIDKYVLIDMYAFRDVVDAMGGIDVFLEEDLIDPSYRVCNDGICGTLYYEAGAHHLDGTAALRVARSRHTTSDYSRAARQQLVLQAIKDKAQSLGFGDAGAVMSLISTMIAATDTNISLDEAVRYYFKYQNFAVSRGYVLSGANVLETKLMPVDYETSMKDTVCLDEENPSTCEDTYVIYTLSPREDDWDIIKWYVDDLL
jgi:LCP family protein required for cell wall assembly